MQSRLESLIEQLLNIGSGFILSLGVWTWVVVPVWHLPVSHGQNVQITLLFTAVSIVRSYLWRRLFNRRHNKKNKSHEHQPHRPDGQDAGG